MANLELLQAGRKLAAARSEQNKVRDEQMASNAIYKQFPRMSFLKSDEPLFFSFLHEKVYEFYMHIVWNEERKTMDYILCEQTYTGVVDDPKEVCATCNGHDGRGNELKPTLVGMATVYAHSNEGKTGETAKGKEYDLDTTINVLFRPGKSMVNLEAIGVLNGKGALKPGRFIFELLKTGTGKETQYHAPKITPAELLGDEFNPASDEFKKALKKYAGKTEDEILQGLFINLKNVKWDDFGIDEPVLDAVESESESTKQPANKKSKDALN